MKRVSNNTRMPVSAPLPRGNTHRSGKDRPDLD